MEPPGRRVSCLTSCGNGWVGLTPLTPRPTRTGQPTGKCPLTGARSVRPVRWMRFTGMMGPTRPGRLRRLGRLRRSGWLRRLMLPGEVTLTARRPLMTPGQARELADKMISPEARRAARTMATPRPATGRSIAAGRQEPRSTGPGSWPESQAHPGSSNRSARRRRLAPRWHGVGAITPTSCRCEGWA